MSDYNLTSISGEEYNRRKKDAIESQAIRKVLPIRDLEIINLSTVGYKGANIKVTERAFADLLKVVGLPVKFTRDLDKLFNADTQLKFIQNLKTAISAQKDLTVTLYVNKADKTCIKIAKSNVQVISNEGALDTISEIVDQGNLIVNNFSINQDDGSFSINTTNPNSLFNIEGFKDEAHTGGVNFTNGPREGFKVTPYVNRLICTNGMTMRSDEDEFTMDDTGADGFKKFFNKLGDFIKRGFRPQNFDKNVVDAVNTPASLYELQSAADEILKVCPKDRTFNDIERWVPLLETRNKYHNIGVDTTGLSQKQMKGAKTGTSIWNLLQGVTNFASADWGFGLLESSRMALERWAGMMLGRKDGFDLGGSIPSPY
jgi:hypothetical protein